MIEGRTAAGASSKRARGPAGGAPPPYRVLAALLAWVGAAEASAQPIQPLGSWPYGGPRRIAVSPIPDTTPPEYRVFLTEGGAVQLVKATLATPASGFLTYVWPKKNPNGTFREIVTNGIVMDAKVATIGGKEWLFLAAGGAGFQVWEVDPTTDELLPRLASSLDLFDAMSVTVAEVNGVWYAFVGTDQSKITIVELTFLPAVTI